MSSDAPSDGRFCGNERRDTAFLPCGIADAGPAELKREMKEVKSVLVYQSFGIPCRSTCTFSVRQTGTPFGRPLKVLLARRSPPLGAEPGQPFLLATLAVSCLGNSEQPVKKSVRLINKLLVYLRV